MVDAVFFEYYAALNLSEYARESRAIHDWRASEHMGGSRPFRVLPVLLIYPVFATSIMLSVQEYGVTLQHVLFGKSRRISPIIGSGAGKAYRVNLRFVSGGSHKRNTQMAQLLRLAALNRIVLRFLQSASMRLK